MYNFSLKKLKRLFRRNVSISEKQIEVLNDMQRYVTHYLETHPYGVISLVEVKEKFEEYIERLENADWEPDKSVDDLIKEGWELTECKRCGGCACKK